MFTIKIENCMHDIFEAIRNLLLEEVPEHLVNDIYTKKRIAYFTFDDKQNCPVELFKYGIISSWRSIDFKAHGIELPLTGYEINMLASKTVTPEELDEMARNPFPVIKTVKDNPGQPRIEIPKFHQGGLIPNREEVTKIRQQISEKLRQNVEVSIPVDNKAEDIWKTEGGGPAVPSKEDIKQMYKNGQISFEEYKEKIFGNVDKEPLSEEEMLEIAAMEEVDKEILRMEKQAEEYEAEQDIKFKKVE